MKNIFIFVADALRYDHLPKSIEKEGAVMRTLAPSLHTPVSFSSLITGLSPEKHNVRDFHTQLDPDIETIYERFEDAKSSYYDFENDAIRKNVLSHLPASKEIGELEEPFLQIERAMETHTPYNEMHHGNDLEKVPDGDYTRSFESDKKLREKYQEGVKGVEEHFWDHVQELEERGLREDTLIIFTSDHGELLGDRINLRKRYAHGNPICRQLVQVPTVFLGCEFEEDYMRTIDIVETALGMVGKESLKHDGADIRSEKIREGKVVVDGYATYEDAWTYSRHNWAPKNPLKTRFKILKNDLNLLKKSFNNQEVKRDEEIVKDIDL